MEKDADISSKAVDDLKKAPDSAGKATDIPKKETNLARKPDKESVKTSVRFNEAHDEPLGAFHA